MKPNRLEAQVGGIEMIDIRRGGLHLQGEVRESGPQGFWGRLGTIRPCKPILRFHYLFCLHDDDDTWWEG